jgi:hypothetical protein
MIVEKGYIRQNVKKKTVNTCSPEERGLFRGRNGRDQAGREATRLARLDAVLWYCTMNA